MTDILNHGALNLAMAIGYKNRIFDVMEDLGRPAAIPEIADAAGLDHRYLTEWLGIMVMGEIVALSQTATGENAYFLPPAHAAFLTRNADSSNLGVYTQEIPLLTACARLSLWTRQVGGGGGNRGMNETARAFPFPISGISRNS